MDSEVPLKEEENALLPSVNYGGNSAAHQAHHYDEYLEKVGFGKYQLWLLILCGWANASDAVEMMGVSFIIASTAECDLELNGQRKGWITASVFIGMMFGGWFWGSLADKHGRRLTLMIAMLINAVFGGLCAIVGTYDQFLALRIVSGLGVGGSMPIVFSYFSEFLPPSRRGALITLLAAFWMLGSMLVAGLAWSVLGSQDCPREESDDLTTRCAAEAQLGCGQHAMPWGNVAAWRLFAVLTAVPALLAALGMLIAPESPKWLLQNQHFAEARRILTNMARSNGKGSALDLPPMGDEACAKSVLGDSAVDRCASEMAVNLSHVMRTTKSLFEPATRRITVLLAGIWFTMCFGFYGLLMWLPEFYREGGVSDDTNPYFVSFLVALSNLPGNLFSSWAVERLGRRMLLVLCLAVSGGCVFSIFGVHSSLGTVVFSCVFSGVSVGGWNALDVLSVELYHTDKRSTAFGFLAAIGRIGAILGNTLFGQMSGGSSALPLVLTGVSLVVGGALAIMLPHPSLYDD